MELIVNGTPRSMPDGATVADLVRALQLVPERIAVERNEQLVRRATYAATQLSASDRIEIVTLVGGG